MRIDGVCKRMAGVCKHSMRIDGSAFFKRVNILLFNRNFDNRLF